MPEYEGIQNKKRVNPRGRYFRIYIAKEGELIDYEFRCRSRAEAFFLAGVEFGRQFPGFEPGFHEFRVFDK